MAEHLIVNLVASVSVLLLAPRLVRTLVQLCALWRPIGVDQANAHVDRIVAMRGRLQVNTPVGSPATGPCLYYHGATRVLSSAHRDYPRDEHSLEEIAAYGLVRDDGRLIMINDFPTNVHECRHSTTSFDRVILWGTEDITHERWLPVHEELTVVGRLQIGAASLEIVRGRVSGLLLSPHTLSAVFWRQLVGLGMMLTVAGAAMGGGIYFVCR